MSGSSSDRKIRSLQRPFPGHRRMTAMAVNTNLYADRIAEALRAKWGDREGLGVLEQLAFGEHHPRGLTGIPGFRPRPPELAAGPRDDGDLVSVARTVDLTSR